MGFDSFLGNPQAVQNVRQMLANDRVPGALIFSGPEGVGKKTLALMFAKALNCERRNPGGDDFCGECARCIKVDHMIAAAREDLERRRETKEAARRVEGLVYFDVQLIEPLTRYILVEQIRRLRTAAASHPFELARSVFVIDSAQAIHWQATDLLLKLLEEPPDTATFILVCPNFTELRATLRSRCRQVRFAPVSGEIIRRLVGDRKTEGRTAEAGRQSQELAVRLAGGSIARAKTLDLEDYRRRRQPWLDYLDGLAVEGGTGLPHWGRIFEATRTLGRDRAEFEEALRIGTRLLRDLNESLAGRVEGVSNLDLLPRLQAWSSRLGFERILRLKEGLDEAYRLQIRNVNAQMGLDALAVAAAETAPNE
jgi:DNA polymerase III subunit delta'